jgi:hypothetical protein
MNSCFTQTPTFFTAVVAAGDGAVVVPAPGEGVVLDDPLQMPVPQT